MAIFNFHISHLLKYLNFEFLWNIFEFRVICVPITSEMWGKALSLLIPYWEAGSFLLGYLLCLMI